MELALLSPIMVLIVMGVLDMARAYRMQIQLENAAREGAAYAQVFPNDVDCAGDDITARAVMEEDGVAALSQFEVAVFAEDANGDFVVPVTGCGGDIVQPGDRVLVEVSALFEVLTPMVERAVGSAIEVTGDAQVRAHA